MKVNNKDYRTVWLEGPTVFLIEQNLLPFEFKIYQAKDHIETAQAIKTMIVRGAGAIGATAGFAMAQAFIEAQAEKDNFWEYVDKAKIKIEASRPTAQDLFYATNRVYNAAKLADEPKTTAVAESQKIAEQNIADCKKIGEYGNKLIKDGFNIETHCNAGWLAFVDWGSALAPIYIAHRAGKKIFVYADETRPRSQGARLTAWELKNESVNHAIIPDNAGAYLMQHGKIDLMIVGSDRIAKNGDVANKIGTLEKAIVAKTFNIPFYVAAPTSTIDLNSKSGKDIPIEQRSEEEVLYQTGLAEDKSLKKVLVASPCSKAINPAFDVTPAEYITGIITEKGIIKAKEAEIEKLITQQV